MPRGSGALKTAATRIGLTVEEYRARQAAGQKWCYHCRAWHPVAAFGRDHTRSDGRAPRCTASRYTPTTQRPGRNERQRQRAAGRAWCRKCAAWLPTAQIVPNAGLCLPHAPQSVQARLRRARVTVSRRQPWPGARRARGHCRGHS